MSSSGPEQAPAPKDLGPAGEPSSLVRSEANHGSAEEDAKRAPDLFSAAGSRLSAVERFNIAISRATLTVRWLDRLMRWCQRVPGATWVEVCTRNLRRVHGLERVPPLSGLGRFVVVSNHRSYFDLFVISSVLFKSAAMRHRLIFPVRSNFFYDQPLGFVVNFAMSWLSMYPPIFRSRKKAALNHTAMNELVDFLARGGFAAGIHPEGTRKKDDDPYTLLPAQSGVGRAIYHSRAPVVPVFINGLGNQLPLQILGNFTKKGSLIHVVFGPPIDFGGLLDQPPTAKTYRAIAERTLEVIHALGQEERALRASAKDAP